MTRAYVGLGANLGDREATLRRAVELLDADPRFSVVAVSTLRDTEPVGVVDQPLFLNGALAVDTTLGPADLVRVLLGVERALGRTREGPRWGPRIVDLDLLAHGDTVIDEPGVTVPHPRLHERRFALEPLAEIAPELIVPGRGAVLELLAQLQDGA
jgi:2-amino-4-hydroxy-6-hydroxymethyldihydropteridine diphosphokinase